MSDWLKVFLLMVFKKFAALHLKYRAFLSRDLGRALRRRVFSRFCIDRLPPTKTILIVSSGRSGSTWLMELLAHANTSRLIFEPFNQQFGIRLSGRWLRPVLLEPETKDVVANVLAGKDIPAWSRSYNCCFIPKARIIKDVSCLITLEAMLKQNVGIDKSRVIYLIRSGREVVISRLNLGWDSEKDLAAKTEFVSFVDQPEIINLFSESQRQLIRTYRYTPILSEVLFWCCENYLAMRYVSSDKRIKIVRYSDLVIDAERTISNLCRNLGLDLRHDLLKAKMTQRSGTSNVSEHRRYSVRAFENIQGDVSRIIRSFELESEW